MSRGQHVSIQIKVPVKAQTQPSYLLVEGRLAKYAGIDMATELLPKRSAEAATFSGAPTANLAGK
jgi:hypothetical protein